MATRSTIKVKGNDLTIYKHWDGSPESTLPWLKDFTKKFIENRGDDEIYFVAQLLRSSVRDAETYQLDDSEFTGWGVIGGDEDFGAAYTYFINLEKGTIKVNNKRAIKV